MSRGEAAEILKQVIIRYERARVEFDRNDYEAVDEELSELRDVLDDIYDRPDEKPKAGQKG